MRYEQEAVQQAAAHDYSDRTWELISEELNDAMASLKHSEREIILRRYYEGMSFKEAGEQLQISENAARVRSTRAVEKLRRHLVNAGVAVTVASLVSFITDKAARAEPSTAVRPLSAAPRLQHIATGATRHMFFTKLSIAGILAIVAITGAAGVYRIHSHRAAYPTHSSTVVVPADQSLLKLASDPVKASDMAGSRIIQKCRAAYDSVQTFEQDAQSSIGGLQGTAHIVFQRPGNLRVTGTTLSAPGMFQGKYDLVCQGNSDAWAYFAGTWSKESSAELGLGAITGISGGAGSGVPALLIHPGGWGDVTGGVDAITSLSLETVNGRAVYRISGAVKDMTTTLWIDQKTFFLVKTQVVRQQASGAVTMTVTYSTPNVNQPVPANAFIK